mgnify:CR=1 FL=1
MSRLNWDCLLKRHFIRSVEFPMKAALLLRSRLAAGWLCAVILPAGWHSAKGCITDCSKPIMLREVKLKDATLEEAVAYVKQAMKKLPAFGDGNINVIILGASEEQKKKKIKKRLKPKKLLRFLKQECKNILILNPELV